MVASRNEKLTDARTQAEQKRETPRRSEPSPQMIEPRVAVVEWRTAVALEYEARRALPAECWYG
jgi:hypothetical protein